MTDTIKAALITGGLGIIGSITSVFIGDYYGMQNTIAQVNTQVKIGIVENDTIFINNVDDLINEYNKLLAENVELKAKNNIPYEEYSNLQQSYNELENQYTDLENQYNELLESNISIQDITSNLKSIEGINAIESYKLLTYVNEYRTEAGIPELSWSTDIAKYAQETATAYIAGSGWSEIDSSIYNMTIRSPDLQDAQKIVSYWIEDTAKSNYLLNATYTQMGGALYYLPDGDEDGNYYFWIISLS